MKRIAVMLIAAGVLCPGTDAGARAEPLRIVITKLDCSRLIRHHPAPDVAYRPGVDVKGRAVAPADIPGSGADAIPDLVPEVLEFPLTINPVAYGARNQAQRDRAAATTPAERDAAEARLAAISAKGLDSTTMTVGTVRYDVAKDTFTLNGQPLGSAEQEELARACRKQGVR